jgi:hypothetical protein
VSPESDAAYLDGGKEGGGIFRISGGDASPSFDVKEGVLDEMPEAVEILVIGALVDSVSLWGDDRVHSLSSGQLKDGIGIVTPVSEKVLCAYAFDKVDSLSAIRCGTFRNKNSERHTMRIHGQM